MEDYRFPFGERLHRLVQEDRTPKKVFVLTPAGKNLNGPSAKVLDEQILAPLGFSRKDAWLYIFAH